MPLHSTLLPHHHPLTRHNEVESFGVAYLVKQSGRDLVLSEETMFPKKLNDEGDLEDEGFIDDSVEVPATSEDQLTFDEAVRIKEQEAEEEKEEEEEEETEVVRIKFSIVYVTQITL